MNITRTAVAIALTTSGTTLPGSAWAEEAESSKGQPLTMNVSQLTLGIDYHLRGTVADNRIQGNAGRLIDADDAEASTTFALPYARTDLKARWDEDTSFRFRYNLASNALEYGYAKRTFGHLWLLAGQTKIKQFGHRNALSGSAKHYKAVFSEAKKRPFSSYQPAIELGGKFGPAKLTVQATNDTTSKKQAAFATEITTEFAGLQPLIQYAVFDMARSHHLSVGGAYQGFGVDFAFDYNMTTVEMGEDHEVSNGLVADIGYTVEDFARPFFSFSTLDVAQPGKDEKANKFDSSSEAYKWSDNATQIVAGVEYFGLGQGVIPFFSYEMISGKFKSLNADGEDTKEDATNSLINFGVRGVF